MPFVKQHTLYYTYSILDAARIFGELDTAQNLQTNFLSLYLGQSEEVLSSVAPYLFSYQPESEFGKWLLAKGWGNSWGLFATTSISLEELRKHFRKFLLVKTEDNEELYFRFYDPRVLRIFLPTCDEVQLKDFFGPVNSYLMEDEDPNFALIFTLQKGELKKERVLSTDVFNADKEIEENEKSKTGTKSDEVSKPIRKWKFLVDDDEAN